MTVVPGVLPGSEEVLVQHMAKGVFVQAVVTDLNGTPIADARVEGRRSEGADWGYFSIRPDPKTGIFRTGPHSPGMWVVSVRAAGYAKRQISNKLEDGSEWDIGSIALSSGGKLRLELSGTDASQVVGTWQILRNEELVGTLVVDKGVATSPALEHGHYTLQVLHEGTACQMIPFDITNNATTFVVAAIRTGQPVSLDMRLPDGESPWGSASLHIYDNAQSLVLFRQFAFGEDATHSFRCSLAPGTYQAVVIHNTSEGRVTLNVHTGATAARINMIRLR
jgi:hypothetical protein